MTVTWSSEEEVKQEYLTELDRESREFFIRNYTDRPAFNSDSWKGPHCPINTLFVGSLVTHFIIICIIIVLFMITTLLVYANIVTPSFITGLDSNLRFCDPNSQVNFV